MIEYIHIYNSMSRVPIIPMVKPPICIILEPQPPSP